MSKSVDMLFNLVCVVIGFLVLEYFGVITFGNHKPKEEGNTINIICKPIKWSSNTRNLFANCHIQSDNDLVLKQNILTFKLKGDPDNE